MGSQRPTLQWLPTLSTLQPTWPYSNHTIVLCDLPLGDHLTHGFQTPKRKVSATSVYFESMSYAVNSVTGLVYYDDRTTCTKMFMPKLLIARGSAYTREWDYERLRQIANSVGAHLMVDRHKFLALWQESCGESFRVCWFGHCTTHKVLRGPRSGMIFTKVDLMERMD